MNRPLVAAAVLSLLAAGGPALAAAEPKHGACKAPAGATVLKAGAKPVESVIATPVGALNSSEQEVSAFYLDLQGKPQSTKGKITLTLSWANPVSDYDLIVNGTNALSSDNPEIASTKASHCRPVKVGVDVFVGVPVDELTLSAKGS
jgi:hypothetical protein